MKKMITILLAMFLTISAISQTSTSKVNSGLTSAGTTSFIPIFANSKKLVNSKLHETSYSVVNTGVFQTTGLSSVGYTDLYFGVNALQPSDARPQIRFQNSLGSFNFQIGIQNDYLFGIYSNAFNNWILQVDGNTGMLYVPKLTLYMLPTSSVGLPSGTVWSNLGVLNIVP